MREQIATTPFGQRAVSLGHIAAQMQVRRAVAEAAKPGSNLPAAVNKWQLFRTLTEIREQLGVSDRALGVLNALLSFHPETALSLPKAGSAPEGDVAHPAEEDERPVSCDLVVFPSNKALSLRAHGMAGTTLRRHLAALVDAGLIIRRDSPNGKRYARKDASGADRFADAFGFDLTPLVTRAPSFDSMLEEMRRVRKDMALTRERISLHRRDVGKLIACALDEALPGPWEGFRQSFMGLMTPLRQIRDADGLEKLASELARLRADVSNALESQINIQKMDGNDRHNGQHQSNSNTQWHSELEPASKKEGGEDPAKAEETGHSGDVETKSYPLGMVMEACPDVNDYAPRGVVRTWPEFLETVALIRPMLGISPDAWREAREVLGEIEAHVVVATVLQRSEHSSEATMIPGEQPGSLRSVVNGSPAIKSAGGYLRALTDKARAGEFALGPVLMALIGQRLRARRMRTSQ